MIQVRESIVYVAKDFVRDKRVFIASMNSVVLSEIHTINIVECFFDAEGNKKEAQFISINRKSGEIKIAKDMLRMSDQTIFFWIVWAVIITADETKNILAADRHALQLVVKNFREPYSDFVFEYANMIEGDGSDTNKSRVDALMKLLSQLKN